MNDEKNKPKDDWGMTMPHLRWDEKNADNFEEDFAPPQRKMPAPPPSVDDWSVTEPNIKIPPQNSLPDNDWGMTQPNVNIPKNQPADFDKTVPNFKPPQNTPPPPSSDFDKTVPNIKIPPSTWEQTAPNNDISAKDDAGDWGMTAPNIPLPKADEKPHDHWSMPKPVFRVSSGETPGDIQNYRKDPDKTNPNLYNAPKRADNFDKTVPNINLPPKQEDFGSTMPNINLAEIQPSPYYQTAPNIAAQTPVAEREIAPTTAFRYEKPAPKSSNMKWILLLGGLFVMFLLIIGAMIAAYFLFFNKPERVQIVQPQVIETPNNETIKQPKMVKAVSAVNLTVLPQEKDFKGEIVLVKAGSFTVDSGTAEAESEPAHSDVSTGIASSLAAAAAIGFRGVASADAPKVRELLQGK